MNVGVEDHDEDLNRGTSSSLSHGSSSSVKPVHPLGGLPPEVWEKIFNKLDDDPETLFRCYRTCTAWERILEPDKFSFMFVFVAPPLKNYLSVNDFIKCREVCKNWRHSVNKTFQNTSLHLRRDPLVHSGVPPFIWYNDTLGVTFNTSTEIQDFLNDFEDPSISSSSPSATNPFFHKTVKLISRNRNNDQESNRLFENFTRLISSNHGPSILSCVYIANGGKPQSEIQMEHLFQQLPNLKSLAILTNGVTPPPEDNVGLSWLINKKNLLPQLPDLLSLNIYLNNASLIAELLLNSYGNQLKSFHCDFTVISSCAYFRGPVPERGLSNIIDLDVFDAFGSSIYLQRLLLFVMPLERLSLEYIEVGPRRQAFKSILKLIDKHSSTLREIRLPRKLFNWESEDSPENSKEFLKSSKIYLTNCLDLGVNIEVLECPVRTWFLGKFINLERLSVTDFGVMFYCQEDKLQNDLNEKLKPFWEAIRSVKKISVERAYLGKLHFYR